MGTKLFVGNLTFNTGEIELRDAFGPHGTVTEVDIVSDRFTGRPRGFAFVSFSTEEEAKLAIEKMNGTNLGGNTITVNEAKPRENSSPSAGGRTFTSPNRKAGAFHARGKRRF